MRRLDHVVHAVSDLDGAADAYAEAGFVVTGRADHPFGTSNRLVLLGGPDPGCYVELVAVTRPARIPPSTPDRLSFADAVRTFLADGPGAAMLVLGSDDPDADHADLERRGLHPLPVFSFSRPAPLPDGTTATVSFDLVPLHPLGPHLGVFLCRHRTPELLWRPEYLRHPNGAAALRELVVIGGPEQTEPLAALTGSQPTSVPGGTAFDLAGVRLSVLDPAAYRARFETPPPRRRPPVPAAVVMTGTREVSTTIAGLRIEVAVP